MKEKLEYVENEEYGGVSFRDFDGETIDLWMDDVSYVALEDYERLHSAHARLVNEVESTEEGLKSDNREGFVVKDTLSKALTEALEEIESLQESSLAKDRDKWQAMFDKALELCHKAQKQGNRFLDDKISANRNVERVEKKLSAAQEKIAELEKEKAHIVETNRTYDCDGKQYVTFKDWRYLVDELKKQDKKVVELEKECQANLITVGVEGLPELQEKYVVLKSENAILDKAVGDALRERDAAIADFWKMDDARKRADGNKRISAHDKYRKMRTAILNDMDAFKDKSPPSTKSLIHNVDDAVACILKEKQEDPKANAPEDKTPAKDSEGAES